VKLKKLLSASAQKGRFQNVTNMLLAGPHQKYSEAKWLCPFAAKTRDTVVSMQQTSAKIIKTVRIE
jgi:hypothetical protein